MAEEIIAYSEANHPARHRDRVALTTLFFGLFAAPIAWAGNLMLTYGLSAHACYPGSGPLKQAIEGFGFAWPMIVACYIAALAICAASGVVSFRNWRITGQEVEGHIHHLIEKGEGRTRYLSIIGMGFSVLFFAAVLFGAIVLAIVPLCAY
jgi:hypothetical protein